MSAPNDYNRCAFDFVESVDRLDTVDSVMDAMAKAFTRFGFGTIILVRLPNPEERFEQIVLAKRWPAEWCKIYTANDYIRVDPVARQVKASSRPFEWAEARYDPKKEPRAAEVMARAADFGLVQGFVVPVHNPNGYEAGVSLGGTHLDLTVRDKAAIHLMSIYGFDRVRRLMAPTSEPQRLTGRERDVLAWSARGKSAWEIGEILHITQRTVEEHAARASQKLGATNRTHAVAIALRERLIEP